MEDEELRCSQCGATDREFGEWGGELWCPICVDSELDAEAYQRALRAEARYLADTSLLTLFSIEDLYDG